MEIDICEVLGQISSKTRQQINIVVTLAISYPLHYFCFLRKIHDRLLKIVLYLTLEHCKTKGLNASSLWEFLYTYTCLYLFVFLSFARSSSYSFDVQHIEEIQEIAGYMWWVWFCPHTHFKLLHGLFLVLAALYLSCIRHCLVALSYLVSSKPISKKSGKKGRIKRDIYFRS